MFEGKEMQWHSVWDQEGMQDKGHSYRLEVEPLLPALLLCVSEVAGALVEQELFKLCAKDRPFAETGKRCTGTSIFYGAVFILLRYLLLFWLPQRGSAPSSC